MINIRHRLFETNSSSVHTMTLLTKEEYDRWMSEDCYLDFHFNRLMSKDEFLDYCKDMNYDPDDPDTIERLQYSNIFSSESFDEYVEENYFEVDENSITKEGVDLVSICYYGHD